MEGPIEMEKKFCLVALGNWGTQGARFLKPPPRFRSVKAQIPKGLKESRSLTPPNQKVLTNRPS